MSDTFNVVVIGGGSAGLVSAYIAATVKAKVALIERNKMGGDCLNYGCVPSKALIRASRIVADMRNADRFGIHNVKFEVNFSDVMTRVHNVINDIEPHDSVERYSGLGVECIQGDARILDKHTIQVGNRQLKTRNMILALGASPAIPPIVGLHLVRYLTSENLWELKTLPKHLVILGGGPIGCEMAQAFANLGSKVTIVEMGERIMPRDDHDVAAVIDEHFRKLGINILLKSRATAVHNQNATHALIYEQDGKQHQLQFDKIFLAVGRKPNTDGVDWEKLGIELYANKTFKVDKFLRTTQKNIYACGDVIGPYQFTHVASHQAWFCSVNALFSPLKKFPVSYNVIPWCTFTEPEVAQVGHTEQTAKQANLDYEVTKYDVKELDRAIAEGKAYGFVKVLTQRGKDKVLGATIVAHNAGELITEYVSAMKHGIGLNKILSTIHCYPTMSEANKYAAGEWKRNHAPQWALKLVEKYHRLRR